MSDKYIKLSFTNAKYFPKNTRTKDIIANATMSRGKFKFEHSNRSSNELSSFREPITVHQISNMLHTLVGERPIPSFRKVFYKADESIFAIANRSFLRINSPMQKRNVGGENVYKFISETTALAKSKYNSNSKPNIIHWFKIEKFMEEHFKEFVERINSIAGYDVTEEPFENLFGVYPKYGSKLDALIDDLKTTKKTPIANFLIAKDQPRVAIVSALGEKIVRGIDTVHVLDGEILVPYKQNFVDRLMKNTTSILDGGYVEIVGVFHEDELGDTNGFVQVSEISDEKY